MMVYKQVNSADYNIYTCKEDNVDKNYEIYRLYYAKWIFTTIHTIE